MKVDCEFISVGCNVTYHALDWSAPNTIAYGAHNAVALLDAKKQTVFATLSGHTAKVNAVKFARSYPSTYDAPKYLFSAGTDGRIIGWETSPTHTEWTKIVTIEAHKDSATSIDALLIDDATILVSSTSADSTAKIWNLKKTIEEGNTLWKAHRLDEYNYHPKMMLCTSMTILQGSNAVLLSFGGMDGAVHLFIQTPSGKFCRIPSLKGHTDWINNLCFSNPFGKYSLLASSAQDTMIRLWKLEHLEPEDPLIDTFSRSNDEAEVTSTSLSTKGTLIRIRDGDAFVHYSILLESVLQGHEDWVHSICWHPPATETGISPPCLLSASMDRTMAIWQPDPETGIWLNEIRVGEMGGMTLGFYRCAFSPNGQEIIVNGYNGAFHLWEKSGSGDGRWEPKVVASGHYGSVDDLSWDTDRNFLLSVSQDQTARIFSKWERDGSDTYWYEIARPQVHGHDLNCVAVISNKHFQYVSGADEKVLRAFYAPKTFQQSLLQISKVTAPDNADLPIGAIVPPLGLSNKPIFESDLTATGVPSELMEQVIVADEEGEEEEGDERKFNLSLLTSSTFPPFEEHLLQNTLWPESQKLYGHGNEIVCVSCNNSGSLIASACKATTQPIAAIRLWNTSNWKCVGTLSSHKLTVTQLQFSPNDNYLLSVSRDRHFVLYSKVSDDSEEGYSYKEVADVDAHERIIWGCAWSPLGDSFATGSRDKKVKIWAVEEGSKCALRQTLPSFSCGVTAVDWCRVTRGESASDVLAVGLEDGSISIWVRVEHEFTRTAIIDSIISPVSTIKRLRWR
eukprot:TRINITY_DN3989_c0_g1_i2.p1 TRINITY_DN3989_c0_g1~~TRINITY_DN3989_c0_g1_i2.p1  ORF type:complete len:792 (-),score=139.94 TRINITY_DN3989_c0_g1_i2:378-2753(-)